MTLLESLADIEHRQWVTWAKRILEDEPGISKQRRERWEKLFGPYCALPEHWKEYDREWARKVLREIQLQVEPDAVREIEK